VSANKLRELVARVFLLVFSYLEENMLAQMPLPWTLDSFWVLFQLGVQIAFVLLVVAAIAAFCALMIASMTHSL